MTLRRAGGKAGVEILDFDAVPFNYLTDSLSERSYVVTIRFDGTQSRTLRPRSIRAESSERRRRIAGPACARHKEKEKGPRVSPWAFQIFIPATSYFPTQLP